MLIVPVVYGNSFDVNDIPTYLDNQFNFGEFVGGLVASLFVLMIVLLPTIYLTKGKAYSLYIILSLATMAPLVGMGWLPIWLYIIILLTIALRFGQDLASWLGGLRR